MAVTEAQKRAQLKYRKKYSKTQKKVQLELNKDKDSDIIEKLETVPSKQGYIKNLIRSDISKNSKIADK